MDREVVKRGIMCLATIKARHPDDPSPVLDAMGTWKYWQEKEYGWSPLPSDDFDYGPLIPLCHLVKAYNYLGDVATVWLVGQTLLLCNLVKLYEGLDCKRPFRPT